jgi:hypothetical protein
MTITSKTTTRTIKPTRAWLATLLCGVGLACATQHPTSDASTHFTRVLADGASAAVDHQTTILVVDDPGAPQESWDDSMVTAMDTSLGSICVGGSEDGERCDTQAQIDACEAGEGQCAEMIIKCTSNGSDCDCKCHTIGPGLVCATRLAAKCGSSSNCSCDDGTCTWTGVDQQTCEGESFP